MTLLRALQSVQRAAKPGAQLNKYLQAYVEHQGTAGLNDVATLLDYLRKDFNAVEQRQRWLGQCRKHEGYKKLRWDIFENEVIKEASGFQLSRIYNNMRRISQSRDAERMWPLIEKQRAKGKMDLQDLLRMWSSVPREKLSDLDSEVAQALRQQAKVSEMQLKTALSRADALPPNSPLLQLCARLLSKQLQDCTSEGLAALVPLVHKALQQGAQIDAGVLERVKEELIKRGGTLHKEALCTLLPAIQSDSDPLWQYIRSQLLECQDLKLRHLLDLLEFLHRASSATGERRLKGNVVKQLKSILSTGLPHPDKVDVVIRRLEVISPHEVLCQALLNTGIALRQDLYPTVLWRLFVRAGEAGLREQHPQLQARFHRIGEILESHAIQKSKMSLDEMLSMVRAIRANKVNMPKCAQQITERFLEILQKAEALPWDGSAEETPGQTAMDGAPGPDEGEVGYEDATTEEDSKEVASTAVPSSPSELLSEVHRLALLLFAELQQQGTAAAALEQAAVAICNAEVGSLKARAIVECYVRLEAIEDATLRGRLCAPLSKQLPAQMASLSPGEQLQLLDVQHPELLSVVVHEIETRMADEKLDLPFEAVAPAVVSCLQYLLGARGSYDLTLLQSLASKVVQWLVTSVGHRVHDDPVATMRAIHVACTCLSTFGLERPFLDEPLRQGLQALAGKVPGWQSADTVELVFGLACAYAGKLPFDVLTYSWQLAGRDAASSHSDDVLKNPKLWAFVLGAQHLSSLTVLASLRLAPDAPALDASIAFPKKDIQMPSFALERESESEALVQTLRLAVPATVPEEDVAEQLKVRGTPYVADFAFERLQTLLIVPRKAHGAGKQLSGFGRLMESTLEAMGWRTVWLWPEDWQALQQKPPEKDALEALRAAIQGKPEETTTADAQDESSLSQSMGGDAGPAALDDEPKEAMHEQPKLETDNAEPAEGNEQMAKPEVEAEPTANAAGGAKEAANAA